jgi:hypothetical protein
LFQRGLRLFQPGRNLASIKPHNQLALMDFITRHYRELLDTTAHPGLQGRPQLRPHGTDYFLGYGSRFVFDDLHADFGRREIG